MRRLLLAITIAVAYFFCLQAVWISCRFFEYRDADGSSMAAGLFALSYRHDQCVKYRDVFDNWRNLISFSATTKTAQAMGVLATLFGSIAVLFAIFGSCLLSCCAMSKRTWRSVLAGSLLCAAICQSLTFLIFVQVHQNLHCDDPDRVCGLGWAGVCSAVATALYFLAGCIILVFAFQPPKDNPGSTMLVNLANKWMTQAGISWKASPLSNLRLVDVGLLLVSLALFLCSLTVILDCHFYTVNFNNGTRQYSEGLLFYHYYPDDKCARFEKGDLQSFKSASRAAVFLGVLAACFGGFLMLLLWSMVLVFNYPPVMFLMLPVVAFLAGLCQSLVFLSNQERNNNLCSEDLQDQTCDMGYNAIMAMIGFIVYILFIPALLWYRSNPNLDLPPPPKQDDIAPAKTAEEEEGGADAEKDEMAPPVAEAPLQEAPQESTQ